MSQIVNIKTGEIIAKEYRLVRGIWGKARGLMFSKKKNLIFEWPTEREVSIHMLFVFFPIEALFLDKDKRVIAKKWLKPFTLNFQSIPAKWVIELPYKTKTKINDILRF
ncbi:MAG: DUF192 domain-containing protein [Candidatus Woesearchaeota archaeon]